jgi:hypothetical protein
MENIEGKLSSWVFGYLYFADFVISHFRGSKQIYGKMTALAP